MSKGTLLDSPSVGQVSCLCISVIRARVKETCSHKGTDHSIDMTETHWQFRDHHTASVSIVVIKIQHFVLLLPEFIPINKMLQEVLNWSYGLKFKTMCRI